MTQTAQNLDLILFGWVDALRRRDPRGIADRLAADVVWQGLRPDLVCPNRHACCTTSPPAARTESGNGGERQPPSSRIREQPVAQHPGGLIGGRTATQVVHEGGSRDQAVDCIAWPSGVQLSPLLGDANVDVDDAIGEAGVELAWLGGEDERVAAADHDCVLEVRRPRAVGRDHSPAITSRADRSGTRGDDWLDREHKPFAKRLIESGNKHVGNVWRLMNSATDPVPNQLRAARVPVFDDGLLDRLADRVQRRSRSRGSETGGQRMTRRGDQGVVSFPGSAYWHSYARVRVEPVELGGDIELDQITIAQPPGTWDAVHRLVVD